MGFRKKDEWNEPKEFTPIQEGWGIFMITQAVPCYTKSKGLPQIAFRFQRIGEHEDENRTFRQWISFADDWYGLGRYQMLLNAIHAEGWEWWDPNSEPDGVNLVGEDNRFAKIHQDQIREHFIGAYLGLEIQHRKDTYTNSSGKVGGVKVEFRDATKLTEGQINRLKDRYGAGKGYVTPPLPDDKHEGLDKPLSAEGPPPDQDDDPGWSDDDIPF